MRRTIASSGKEASSEGDGNDCAAKKKRRRDCDGADVESLSQSARPVGVAQFVERAAAPAGR